MALHSFQRAASHALDEASPRPRRLRRRQMGEACRPFSRRCGPARLVSPGQPRVCPAQERHESSRMLARPAVLVAGWVLGSCWAAARVVLPYGSSEHVSRSVEPGVADELRAAACRNSCAHCADASLPVGGLDRAVQPPLVYAGASAHTRQCVSSMNPCTSSEGSSRKWCTEALLSCYAGSSRRCANVAGCCFHCKFHAFRSSTQDARAECPCLVQVWLEHDSDWIYEGGPTGNLHDVYFNQ